VKAVREEEVKLRGGGFVKEVAAEMKIASDYQLIRSTKSSIVLNGSIINNNFAVM